MHINGNYNDKTLLRPAKHFTHRILSHLQHPFYSEKFTLFQITVSLYPYIRESVLAILENIIIKEKKNFLCQRIYFDYPIQYMAILEY